MQDLDDTLTAKQAADHLYTTENSLRSMRSKRCGPPFVKQDGRVLYSRAALDAYVDGLRDSDRSRLANRRSRVEKERGASTA